VNSLPILTTIYTDSPCVVPLKYIELVLPLTPGLFIPNRVVLYGRMTEKLTLLLAKGDPRLGHGICIPAMDDICIYLLLTTQRKDGEVERVSPSLSEGRMVEWNERLPLPSPCTACFRAYQKDGYGRLARSVDDI
jgi:hypothetical protein